MINRGGMQAGISHHQELVIAKKQPLGAPLVPAYLALADGFVEVATIHELSDEQHLVLFETRALRDQAKLDTAAMPVLNRTSRA